MSVPSSSAEAIPLPSPSKFHDESEDKANSISFLDKLPLELRTQIYILALQDGTYRFRDRAFIFHIRIGPSRLPKNKGYANNRAEDKVLTDRDEDDGQDYISVEDVKPDGERSEDGGKDGLPAWWLTCWEMYILGLEALCRGGVCVDVEYRSWWDEKRGKRRNLVEVERARLPVRLIGGFEFLWERDYLELGLDDGIPGGSDGMAVTKEDDDEDKGEDDYIIEMCNENEKGKNITGSPRAPRLFIPPNARHTPLLPLLSLLQRTGTRAHTLHLLFTLPPNPDLRHCTPSLLKSCTVDLSLLNPFHNPHLKDIIFAIHEPEIFSEDFEGCIEMHEMMYTHLQRKLISMAKQWVQPNSPSSITTTCPSPCPQTQIHAPMDTVSVPLPKNYTIRTWYQKERYQGEARGWSYPTEIYHHWHLAVSYKKGGAEEDSKKGVEEGDEGVLGIAYWHDPAIGETHFGERRRVGRVVEWEAPGYGTKSVVLPEGWE